MKEKKNILISNVDVDDEEEDGNHNISQFQTQKDTDQESVISSYQGGGNGDGVHIRPKFLKTHSMLEREKAAYHDHGRHHFASERMAASEEDDPFLYVFTFVDRLQELAIPLILGVVVALILANTVPDTYKYYFASDRCEPTSDDDHADDHARRQLFSTGCDDHSSSGVCHEERFLLSDCLVFGHQFTLHFLANDIIMSFFFGLAMKEVVEAVLPGGSLNPPSKAMNPILTTIGGVVGPVVVYIATLKLFITLGVFNSELERGLHYDDLMQGWGVVTATDIVLAWLVGRLVFGDGHPAIDFLLLLAVADDAIGMAIIAIFYPDPEQPVRPAYLTIVFGAMGISYALRKWHFRKERVTHQPWQPYIFFSGLVSWIGLVEAHLHPALALVFVVPFMPGPDLSNLDHLEEEVEDELEEDTTGGKAHDMLEQRRATFNRGEFPERVDESDILAYHHEHRGRGMSIQAGLFGGLAGHRVDDAFKVVEYDEDGQEHLHVSTLDSFEHFWKIYVDFGLGLFALCNAGVKIEGVGGMTYVVLISLVVGKYTGILLMYKFAKWLGFLPPLGVRTRHIRMIGLLASMGLTVALFVSDVAFTDVKLQGEAKLGALLSGMVGFVAYGISHFFDFSHERVDDQAKLQLKEEMEEANHKLEANAQRYHARGRGISFAGVDLSHSEGMPKHGGMPKPTNTPMTSSSGIDFGGRLEEGGVNVDGHGPIVEAGL